MSLVQSPSELDPDIEYHLRTAIAHSKVARLLLLKKAKLEEAAEAGSHNEFQDRLAEADSYDQPIQHIIREIERQSNDANGSRSEDSSSNDEESDDNGSKGGEAVEDEEAAGNEDDTDMTGDYEPEDTGGRPAKPRILIYRQCYQPGCSELFDRYTKTRDHMVQVHGWAQSMVVETAMCKIKYEYWPPTDVSSGSRRRID